MLSENCMSLRSKVAAHRWPDEIEEEIDSARKLVFALASIAVACGILFTPLALL